MSVALALAVVVANAAPTLSLTEEQAVALALRESPQVKSRRDFLEESEAQTEASLAWNNPLVRATGLRYDELIEPGLGDRSYGRHPLYHASVGMRWSPPGLGERSAVRAAGLAHEADARMELAVVRRDTVALVRRLHAEILSDDAELTLDRDVAEQRAKLRALVKSRLERQAATMLDQSLSEVDYLDAQAQLAELEVRRRAAYDELRIQLGLPSDQAITLVPSDDEGCSAPESAVRLAERARAANPRLRLLNAELGAADAERRRRWMELIPWFDYLQVSYGFAGDNNPGYVAFQLQLTLPLLDWKRPHRRALAARKNGLLERIVADDRALTSLVLRTAAAQAEHAALVERYREAAAVVDEGLSRLRKAVADGLVTNLFEVVQLQTRLLATKRSYLRARLGCKLQRIELDRLTSSGVEPQE
jgi:outer membrane protein TolC